MNWIKLFFIVMVMVYTGHKVYPKVPDFSFIENKGQWNDTVRYKTGIGNGALFLTDEGFVYNFVNDDYFRSGCGLDEIVLTPFQSNTNQAMFYQCHAYKVIFVNANQHGVVYEGFDKRSWYHNYFIGNDSTRWTTNVSLFGKVKRRNVYRGIDLIVYNDGQGLKYDFVVMPGANPDEIVMEFDGVLPRLTKEGDLELATTVTVVVEKAPLVYQDIGGRRINIACKYKVDGNQVSFELLEQYNYEYPLVIDPSLIFATHSGATSGSHLGFATTYDKHGNLYAAASSSNVGWPVSIGAYQENFGGMADIGINKYNSAGTQLLFSTYLGGNQADAAAALLVNEAEELVISGGTSSFDFPTTTNCYDNSYNGGTYDFYISKLTLSGTQLIASTLVGGSWNEWTSGLASDYVSHLGMAIDESSNIWIAAGLSPGPVSVNPFPVTENAIQTNFGGGESDGVIFQLDHNLSNLLFSSYMGGGASDVCMDIVINSEGNVVIGGITASNDFITGANGMHTDYQGGVSDGFVVIIDAETYDLLGATFLGTEEEDAVIRLQLDEDDNVLVLGRTLGNYPISASVYHMSGADHYIDKLAADLSSSLLSTRIGKPQSFEERFEPAAFLYDYCGRTYITGFKGDGLFPTTSNSIQTEGGIWIGVLDSDFSGLHYGSFFGTPDDHSHAGISRFDPYGVIYQTICTGYGYPTSSDAVFPEKLNTGLDAVSFKIDMEAEFVEAAIALPHATHDTGCAPYTVQFLNFTYCPFPLEYSWDFGDGSPLDTSTNPAHTFTEPGVYMVVLKASSPLSCNLEDYDTLTIAVFLSDGPDITTQDTVLCSAVQQVELWVGIEDYTPSMTIEWQPLNAIMGPNDRDTVTVLPGESSVYAVRVQDTAKFCAISTAEININYLPRELALLNPDTILCIGDTLAIEAIGSEGYTYQWQPATGVSDPAIIDPYIIATESAQYTLTATHPLCDDTSGSFLLIVDAPYLPTFDPDPDSICVGDWITFHAVVDTTVSHFNWTFGDGSGSGEMNGSSIRHAYDSAGVHTVRLNASFRACPDSGFTRDVYVYGLPNVDLGPDTSLCLDGRPITLRSLADAPQEAHHYLWNTGDTTASLRVLQPGSYSLRISTEPLGCNTTDVIEVTKDCYTDIPNAFTPNGDGDNDYFFPRTLLSKSVTEFRMQVFNRWGQLVFETTRTDGRGWDGRFNDKDQPLGVYIYLVDVGYSNGRQEQYKGNVTLIR